MAKTFKIDLQLNNQQADAASNRAVAALAQVEKAAARTAAAAERALLREAQAREKAAQQAQRTADRRAEVEIRAAERAARQRMSIEDRMVARENSRMVAAERAAQRAADAAVRAKEQESRRIQAIRAREDQQSRSLQDRRNREFDRGANAPEGGGGRGGRGGAGLLTEMSSGLNLFQQAAGMATAVIGSFNAVNNKILESTNLVTSYQENLLELAALKGVAGKTGDVMAEDIGFRAKTLQTAAQSKAFKLSALGVGESSLDTDKTQRLISKAEFEKSLEFGGAVQAATDADADTMGRLVGMIPQMIGRRTDSTEVSRKLAQYIKIINPGGFSTSSGANQFGQLAPLITTGLYKDTEALALLSAFSTTNPGGAGTNVEQFTRGTVGSLGRMRGVSVEGAEKIGPYLKSLGATNQMSPMDIGNLISEDITKFEGTEKAAGRQANVMDYLKMHGYANIEDISAISAYHGLRKSRAIQDTFMPLAADQAMPTMEQANAFRETFKRGRVGQQRAVAVSRDAADANIGNEPLAMFEAQREAAFHRLRARRDFFMGGMDYADTKQSGPWDLAADAAISHEMYADLNRRRGQVGLAPINRGLGSWKTLGHVTQDQQADQLFRGEQEIAAAGGEAGVNIDPLVEMGRRQLELGERQVAALEKMAGGTAPGGIAGPAGLPDSAPPVAGAIR